MDCLQEKKGLINLDESRASFFVARTNLHCYCIRHLVSVFSFLSLFLLYNSETKFTKENKIYCRQVL